MPDTHQVPLLEEKSMLLDLDVPPVRHRNPDPSAGPRLNVKEFRLQGLVEYPELGITREALIEHVEKIRFDMMREDQLGEWGYTEQEVSEIADLVGDIEEGIGDEHVGAIEVQRLVFLIRDQRRKRGVTLGMIEGVAAEITQFYRERGFILAKAYIPEQKVRDGVVTLTLLLGELGHVEVNNDGRVSEGLIQRAFKKDIGKPVTAERLEEALYLVNDIPGLSARSVLSPGKQVGDTMLSVNVEDERWFSSNFRIDNHGSEETSKNRAYADLYVHNPSGLGDEVYLAILKTFNPDNSTYGALRYSSFWGLPRLRTSVGVSTNEFVSRLFLSGAETPLFTGESEVKDASVEWVIDRRRVKNISAGFKYANIETTLDTFFETVTLVDQATAMLNFDVLNEKRRQLYRGQLAVHNVKSEFEDFGDLIHIDVNMLNFDLSSLMFAKIPFTEIETRLLLRAAGQYAGERTSSVVQMSLTGEGRARVFSINGMQADDGLYFGADWFFPMPGGGSSVFGHQLGEMIQPYVFLDASYGRLYPFSAFDEETVIGQFADAGLGLKFHMFGVSADIYAGSVLMDKKKGVDTDEPTETAAFGIELSYSI
ncbi:ShlB/FhaC/HecB family hemolysin secretion/activation protein [Agaribacterium haliotis]|uniref:ShlB/FhaC/HecB family hemolysin secretion/activation protein n=1 Tax=Agaribacterium haliotis TaxID=2013869 RepID=UPI001304306E|nr:ShlB/FhaC/HecB family hemolysin secretion/activation protein [Agaribacterium haliotis]